MTTRVFPPDHLIRLIGSNNHDDYISIADHFFNIFLTYGKLKPTDAVLDVGCGCGRLAWPLTDYLTTGTYDGFDVMPDAITWCTENMSKPFPNFKFKFTDVYNTEYNTGGKIKAKNFKFPYPDNSFDFTFLTSVFTHMVPDDLKNYAREVARTLKPTGTALITFFILNDDSQRLRETDASKVKFPFPYGKDGIRVAAKERPEAVIAYPEPMAIQIMAESGLIVEQPIHHGFWCGRPEKVTFQDLTLSHKK